MKHTLLGFSELHYSEFYFTKQFCGGSLLFFSYQMCRRQSKPNLWRFWFCFGFFGVLWWFLVGFLVGFFLLVFCFYKKALDRTALHSITQCLAALEIPKSCAGVWNSQPQFFFVGFTLWCTETVGVSETRTPRENLPNLEVLRRGRVGTETMT